MIDCITVRLDIYTTIQQFLENHSSPAMTLQGDFFPSLDDWRLDVEFPCSSPSNHRRPTHMRLISKGHRKPRQPIPNFHRFETWHFHCCCCCRLEHTHSLGWALIRRKQSEVSASEAMSDQFQEGWRV